MAVFFVQPNRSASTLPSARVRAFIFSLCLRILRFPFMPQSLHKTLTLRYFENDQLLTSGEQQLIASAKKAVDMSYAPYSQFYVGASILTERGELITGSNQENASFPHGLCAERVALNTYANIPDPSAIISLAVAARSDRYAVPEILCPCGGCLQVMAEFVKRQNRDFSIFLCHPKGGFYKADGLSVLLPFGFELRN